MTQQKTECPTCTKTYALCEREPIGHAVVGGYQRKQAKEVFHTMMDYTMSYSLEIPQTVIEAFDFVANYVGDVSFGREVVLEKPSDAFPTLINQAILQERERLVGEIEKMKMAYTDLDSKRLRYEKQARNKVVDDIISLIQSSK